MVEITLDKCLEKLGNIGIDSKVLGNMIKLEGFHLSIMRDVYIWGFLDVAYENSMDAYVPTRGYFKRCYCNSWKSSYYLETYESMVSILKGEGFNLQYFTDVEEI